jgi:hypothetical protein
MHQTVNQRLYIDNKKSRTRTHLQQQVVSALQRSQPIEELVVEAAQECHLLADLHQVVQCFSLTLYIW